MELFEVMRTTFAAREYTGAHLSDEILYEILENARFAPSGGNRQGNHVIVVRENETRKEFVKLLEPAAKRYQAQAKAGENPWNTVSPTKVTPDDIANTEAPRRLMEPYKTADVLLVVTVDLTVVASTDQYLDRVGIISGASIYPFVWNILMAARQAGYGGTITTLAAAEEPRVQKLLNIPKEFAVCAVIPLGKPVKQLSKLRRLPVEEIATREQFNGPQFTKP